MTYAILAAGEGSRLAAEGIRAPKPLVKINGEYLIDRLIRIFMNNDAEEIVVICNEKNSQVADHLMTLQRDGLRGRPIPLRFLVKSTPSSMHSFFEISKYLYEKPFIMTTVDTIFDDKDFSDYVRAFKDFHKDGLMGVTSYVDDESPLYVQTDNHQHITAFLDSPAATPFVSAGIYGLQQSSIYTLNNCIARSENRMRNFQRALLTDGRKLKAWPFGQVFDIDHASDIDKAEKFLKDVETDMA